MFIILKSKETKTSSSTKKDQKIRLFPHSHHFCPRDILTILNWFSNLAVVTSPKVHTSCNQLRITAGQKEPLHFSHITVPLTLHWRQKPRGVISVLSEMLILGGQWSQLSTNISRLRQLLERGSGSSNTSEWGTWPSERLGGRSPASQWEVT